jgi:hypothetical protein
MTGLFRSSQMPGWLWIASRHLPLYLPQEENAERTAGPQETNVDMSRLLAIAGK